ncbi:MAG: hypothetical protein ACRC9P_04890 [Bacteroides sp.]
MNESLFIEWVNRYFNGLAVQVQKELTEGEDAPKYFHLEMLDKSYSDDGTWESITGDHKNVAADVVTMDSSIDVKRRDSLKVASGDIPKVGMRLNLTEKQLKKLSSLVAKYEVAKAEQVRAGKGGEETPYMKEIVREIFSDLKRAIRGVYERNEKSFLQGLSSGVILTDDEKDASIGIRVDMKYPEKNQHEAAFNWEDKATATPITDIDAILEENPNLKYIMLQPKQLNQMRKAKETIDNVSPESETKTPVSKTRLIEFLKDEKDLTVIEVKRKVTIEKDGKRTETNPWKEGMVVFMDSPKVGELVWSRVAEMDYPVDGVNYQTVDDYILVSKFRETNPLKESTMSQAMVIPIITQINGIHTLNTKKK